MIRVRIAPSPTGQMHVGTARTALFNWLFARKNNGVFILRIEDTDKERSKKEYEASITNGLKWLGLDWDEGPVFAREQGERMQKGGSPEAPAGASGDYHEYKGEFGPYRQSERGDIYKKYIQKLLDSDSAFWCYHTKEELEAEKKNQNENNEAPRHICDQKAEKSDRGVIRLKNSGGIVKFDDLIRGSIEFDVNLLGDFSVAKDENTALYNLAAAIDDYEMKISHVIRGEDHISNTPKQIMIYNALGLKPPRYAHLSMILGPDRSKLSKRHGATALFDYKDIGYLPEAMFNFLCLLGWSPKSDEEILSKEEITEQFSLEGVQKSGAIFNIEKLDWMNSMYIRNLGVEELSNLCVPYLFGISKEDIDRERLEKIVELEQPRIKKLSELWENIEFFFKDELDYDRDLLKWKSMKGGEIKESLTNLESLINEIPEENFSKSELEKMMMPKVEEWGTKGVKVDRGRTLWPLRAALRGRVASPGPFEIMEILGKEKTLVRIKK